MKSLSLKTTLYILEVRSYSEVINKIRSQANFFRFVQF